MDEENLWGDLPVDDTLATPVSILKQQAAVLSKLTGGLLTGRVTSSPVSLQDQSMILHSFAIVAPGLSNYSVEIVRVFNPPFLYPAKLRALLPEAKLVEVTDEAALKEKLTEVFQDKRIHGIVRNLMAQVREETIAGGSSRKGADVDDL